MRWQGKRSSSNIEDRRGQRPRGPRRGKTIGGGVILLVIVGALLGADPQTLLQIATSGGGQNSVPTSASGPVRQSAEENEQAKFVSVILADTEDTWSKIFAAQGKRYPEPSLVLFRDAVNSACGMNSAAVGPFYCPPDQKVYIDLSFFNELSQKFGAPGDFAQAYVIAHEVGHHLQTVLGISERVHAIRRRASTREANQWSVKQELQADCFAGVWGHHAAQRNMLETGDIEEGLRAASAIGDDTIQRRAQGRVSPESWTHGSSKQRVKWFGVGFKAGNMNACATFDGKLSP